MKNVPDYGHYTTTDFPWWLEIIAALLALVIFGPPALFWMALIVSWFTG